MTLFVLFIVLLIERYFDWGHLRQWSWLKNYNQFLSQILPNATPGLILALLVLPISLLVFLLNILFANILYGFIHFLFEIFIFLYCLGPQNIWVDMYVSSNSLSRDEIAVANDKLKMTFNVHVNAPTSLVLHKALLNQFFIACNHRVFACLVFYLLFGTVGVVFYRLIHLLAKDAMQIYVPSPVSLRAQALLAVCDWLPVRILTFLFALAGHFMRVFKAWVRYVITGFNNNEPMLVACGYQAVSDNEEKIALDGTIEQEAMSLFDRSLIIFFALIVLGYWSILFLLG